MAPLLHKELHTHILPHSVTRRDYRKAAFIDKQPRRWSRKGWVGATEVCCTWRTQSDLLWAAWAETRREPVISVGFITTQTNPAQTRPHKALQSLLVTACNPAGFALHVQTTVFDKPQCLPPAWCLTGQIKEPSLQPYIYNAILLDRFKLRETLSPCCRAVSTAGASLNKDCWKSRGHSNGRVYYFYWPFMSALTGQKHPFHPQKWNVL